MLVNTHQGTTVDNSNGMICNLPSSKKYDIYKVMENIEIKICGSCSNCPVIQFNDLGAVIKDDFNGTVRLTKEELKILKGIIEKHE